MLAITTMTTSAQDVLIASFIIVAALFNKYESPVAVDTSLIIESPLVVWFVVGGGAAWQRR